MTQTQLGNLLDVSATTVGLWERGETSPTVQDFIKIAAVNGVKDLMIYFVEKITDKNKEAS